MDNKLVGLLLRYGADPTFVGSCKFTPLEAAKSKRDNLYVRPKWLEDDTRRGFHLTNILALSAGMPLASSKAIVQMLEDADRLR